MKPFAYARPKTEGELMALLSSDAGVRMKGGGVDLLDLAKSGVSTPTTLVDVGNLPQIKAFGGGMDGSRPPLVVHSLGAGMTLANLVTGDIAGIILKDLPALADAAAAAATPQIRNVATLAGNLLQRPRCAYFRDPFFDCLKRGGKTCPALEGEHSEGAIFGNGKCCSVHPSNLAVALLAADARIGVRSLQEGGRTWVDSDLSLSTQFFALLERAHEMETVLRPSDLIQYILVPKCPASAYVEVDQKQSFDWASASAAVALEMEGGKVKSARVALGAVAPVPLLSEAAAKALVGKVPDEAAAKAAGEAAVQGATPLRDNGHKVQHLRICVQRAVLKAAARGR